MMFPTRKRRSIHVLTGSSGADCRWNGYILSTTIRAFSCQSRSCPVHSSLLVGTSTKRRRTWRTTTRRTNRYLNMRCDQDSTITLSQRGRPQSDPPAARSIIGSARWQHVIGAVERSDRVELDRCQHIESRSRCNTIRSTGRRCAIALQPQWAQAQRGAIKLVPHASQIRLEPSAPIYMISAVVDAIKSPLPCDAIGRWCRSMGRHISPGTLAQIAS
jgi:hypothetical protein